MLRRVLIVAALVGFAGCGDSGPAPAPVTGIVTLDGEPLAEGTVYFKTPSTGAVDPLEVKAGKFSGTALEGERRVEVNAYRTKIVGTGAMTGEVKENRVAPRFNTDSTLTATVTRKGPNSFEFAVKSK